MLSAIIANIGLGQPVNFEVDGIRKFQISSRVTGQLVRLMDSLVENFSKLLVVTAPSLSMGIVVSGLLLRHRQLCLKITFNVRISFCEKRKVSYSLLSPSSWSAQTR